MGGSGALRTWPPDGFVCFGNGHRPLVATARRQGLQACLRMRAFHKPNMAGGGVRYQMMLPSGNWARRMTVMALPSSLMISSSGAGPDEVSGWSAGGGGVSAQLLAPLGLAGASVVPDRSEGEDGG